VNESVFQLLDSTGGRNILVICQTLILKHRINLVASNSDRNLWSFLVLPCRKDMIGMESKYHS
jgi:hypothetical protein